MEANWAPAHYSGYQIKVCMDCEAIVEDSRGSIGPDEFWVMQCSEDTNQLIWVKFKKATRNDEKSA